MVYLHMVQSKLLTFSYLNESDLESTLTSLDQELDNLLYFDTGRETLAIKRD